MINRIVPAAELDDTALAMAQHIAAIDPNLVKETKRAINRAFEAQNMLQALEEALAIDLAIEGRGLARQDRNSWISRGATGLKAALAWRDARFPEADGMSGALGNIVGDALRRLRWNIGAVASLNSPLLRLLTIAERVEQALRARGVVPNEPVICPHRQPSVRPRLAARNMAGRCRRGAASCQRGSFDRHEP